MPICLSCTNSEKFTKVDEKKTEHGYLLKLIKCESCGLVFLENPPPIQDIKKMYSDDRFYDKNTKSDVEEIKARIGIVDYAEEFAVHDSDKLLDAGCAKGHLLVAAKQKGWEPYGIEYSKRYSDYGNSKLGVKIANGELLECLDNTNDSFDIIILWHTLEHVLNPRELLQKLKNKLCKNGVLAIQVPDYEKLGDSIVGTHHVSYFTRESILNLMKNCGLKVLSYDYDFSNSFISVLVRS